MKNLYASAFAGAAGLLAIQAASAQPVQGKLWVVSPAQAANVAFPAPSATPDATFSTNGIAYVAQGSLPNTYRIGRFLGGDVTAVSGLTFSGLPNPNLGGAPVTAMTAMAGQKYGVITEFTGQVSLTNGQKIGTVHDDGISLKIDGMPISGFGSGITAPAFETVTYTGSSGIHAVDLLYANAAGVPKQTGAWVLFSPKLF